MLRIKIRPLLSQGTSSIFVSRNKSSLRSISKFLPPRAGYLSPSFKRHSSLYQLPPLCRAFSIQPKNRANDKDHFNAPPFSEQNTKPKPDLYENIYTLPNFITLGRILLTPWIGYYVVQDDYVVASSLLALAGISDLADGVIARRWKLQSVMGSILDPAADKFLMTVMVGSLASHGTLPWQLAAIIIGRDVALSISAFYWRYITLPPPKTFRRFWDFSIPSAQVNPTVISKYNTFLQLCLISITTVAPLIPHDISTPLSILQYIVAGTTITSGLSYVFTTNAVKVLK